METPVYFASLGLIFATVLGVFAMRYMASVTQARARLTEDNAYRLIAEKAVSTQAETATALDFMSATLLDVRTRLAAVEKMLKDVG